MKEEERILQLIDEYHRLAHAMQSGVAAEMSLDSAPTDAKHLRVGVNSAMVEHAALVELLIQKNVFSKLEYITALRNSMKAEVDRYEKHLQDRFGVKVSLE